MIIKDVEFHDLALAGIEFSFETEEIIVSVKKYNDEAKSYSLRKVYFKGVRNINMGPTEVANLFDMEVYSMDIEESKEVKKAEFNFLTGFSKPNMNLSFEYLDVHFSW